MEIHEQFSPTIFLQCSNHRYVKMQSGSSVVIEFVSLIDIYENPPTYCSPHISILGRILIAWRGYYRSVLRATNNYLLINASANRRQFPALYPAFHSYVVIHANPRILIGPKFIIFYNLGTKPLSTHS